MFSKLCPPNQVMGGRRTQVSLHCFLLWGGRRTHSVSALLLVCRFGASPLTPTPPLSARISITKCGFKREGGREGGERERDREGERGRNEERKVHTDTALQAE